jgi:hypothetical protein
MLLSLTENKNDSLVGPMMIIILFVLIEVIPILIVLDWSFMEIFVIRSDSVSTFHVSGSDLQSSLRSQD